MSNKVLSFAQAVKQGNVHYIPGVYLRTDSQYLLLSANLLAGFCMLKSPKASQALLGSALAGLIVLGGIFSLTSGEWPIAMSSVFKIIFSKLGLYAGSIKDVEAVIIWDGRLPPLPGCSLWSDFPLGAQAPSCREYSRTPWQARG